jgi:serine protease Do
VVRIESNMGGNRVAYGTGFIVGAEGRIATNLHVIAGAEQIKVTLLDGSEHPVEEVVAFDPERDLAIVHIAASKLPTVKLGDSDGVSAGDRVVAIGNPLGVFDYSVSDGLISSVRPLATGITVLQISAPISQGSSGGPLFDPYGEVIGVATFIAREGQNINFGVPSNYLRPLLDKKGGETLATFASHFSGDDDEAPPTAQRKVQRRIPTHSLSTLDGCSPDQILAVFRAINKAIEVGAPVYNRGEHEACFVIYRKVADLYEGDQAMCKGVREAFGQGLLRAESTDDFTEKAWAMRDTFDGLLDVIVRKADASSGG